jgi:hypothetical protein
MIMKMKNQRPGPKGAVEIVKKCNGYRNEYRGAHEV